MDINGSFKLFSFFLFASVVMAPNTVSATVLSAVHGASASGAQKTSLLKGSEVMKDLRKILPAKKKALAVRTGIRFLKQQLLSSRSVTGQPTDKQRRNGKISLILSLLAFASLINPFVITIGMLLAFTALVLGIHSVKGNKNTAGILGVIFSGLYLSVLVVALVIIAFQLIND